MGKTYKHVFFDLDHTLWDFERNAEETKREMFETLKLQERGVASYEAFREKYVNINQALWALYREDKIEKDDLNFRRFYDTLCLLGIDDRTLGQSMADGFIEGISSKPTCSLLQRKYLNTCILNTRFILLPMVLKKYSSAN